MMRWVLAVAEIHDPRRWPNVASEDAARRLRFYERFGACVLDVPFVQLALANGRPRIPGFLLIALYVDPAVLVQVDGESMTASNRASSGSQGSWAPSGSS
jgi:hypothetical protein